MRGDKSGIYQIRNARTGRLYVGSSVGIRARWHNHRSDLRRGIHRNPKLQAAWNKYGEDAFEFSVIQECAPEALIERERYWLGELKPFYNINAPEPTRLGMKNSEEHKAKQRKPRGPMSQAHKDAIRAALTGKPQKKRGPMSAEHRAIHSAAMKGRVILVRRGVPLSEEHRQRVSAALSGRSPDEAHRAKLAAANRGKPFSDERRRAISAGRKGITPTRSDEHRQHLSEALKGRRSDVAIAASAKARSGKPLDDEHRAKLSASATLRASKSEATRAKMRAAQALRRAQERIS